MKSTVEIPKHIENKLIRIKHLEDVDKHLKERARALQHEAKALEYERQELRKDVQEFMEYNDLTKMKSPTFIVDYVPGNVRLNITDEALIPNKYKVISSTINRRKLLNDKDCFGIPGVTFEDTKVILIKHNKK